MKIYVCMIPGDDILIAGASFDKRICYNKYWERKSALEEKYRLTVTHAPDECVHEVEIEGSTCLHLCIAGHYSDKEVVGAVIGDEDMHSMMSMMDRLNHQATDDGEFGDYFHCEDIMLGLPDVNQRHLNKYEVVIYHRSERNPKSSYWDRYYAHNDKELEKLFQPKISLLTADDVDELWNFGAPPQIDQYQRVDWITSSYDGKSYYRIRYRISCYATDESQALKIASDTLTTYLARKEGLT